MSQKCQNFECGPKTISTFLAFSTHYYVTFSKDQYADWTSVKQKFYYTKFLNGQ